MFADDVTEYDEDGYKGVLLEIKVPKNQGFCMLREIRIIKTVIILLMSVNCYCQIKLNIK